MPVDDKENPTDERLWRSAAPTEPALSAACPGQLELASYLDGRLSAAEVESIEAHLAACPECREAAADARLIVAAAARLRPGAPERVIESAQALVSAMPVHRPARAQGRPSLGLKWRMARWLAAAAASVAICVFGYRTGTASTASTDLRLDQLAMEMSFGVFDPPDEDVGEIELIAALLTEKPR
ncbi:MAG: zf-HC2 domain-containing protein [Phycisphaerales bacterium]